MNLLLLLILVILAFIRIEVGIASLLVLTSSLFSLGQFATVQLPLGNVEPTEAILVAMLARRAIDLLRPGKPMGNRRECLVLASAILPYVAWQTICTARGAASWAGTDYLRYSIRFFLAGVLPWVLPLLLLSVPSKVGRCFKVALWVAVSTSVVHAIIQLTDYRPIMAVAYIPPNLDKEYGFVLQGYRQWLDQSEITRFYPQGIMLIVLSAIYMAAKSIGRKVTAWDLAGVGIVLLAIVLTVERNFLFSTLCGVGAALALGARYGKARMRTVARGIAVCALLAAGVGGYGMLRPALLEMWQSRISELFGTDSHIFSEENGYRGLDNVASLRALEAHPLLGLGTPRYPSEYSVRSGPPTDIHPLLVVGLVGGLPAIVLLLRLQWLLLWGVLRPMGFRPAVARDVLPFAAVLVVNCFVLNFIGAGGTTSGNSLVVLGVFVAAAWNECAVRSRTYLRMEQSHAAKNIDPYTVIQPGTFHRADHSVRA